MRSSWPTDDAKGNSSPVDDVVFADQIDALRSALAIGRALGRVVILPRFHCNITTPPASAKTSNPRPSGSRGAGPSGGVSWNRRRKPSAEGASPGPVNRTYFECPLNSLLNLAAFDAAFDGAYRENSFLRHPKVPDAVKQSISSPHGVVTTVEATSKSEVSGEGGATVALSSAPLSLMITELTHGELLSRFGHVTDKVLTLGQLYDVRPRLASNDDQTQFDKLAAKAFRRSNYRQL